MNMELGGRSEETWHLIEVTEKKEEASGVHQHAPSLPWAHREEQIWMERQEAVGYESLQLTRDEAGEKDFRVSAQRW